MAKAEQLLDGIDANTYLWLHPELENHVLRMAQTGVTGTISEWSSFVVCLNEIIKGYNLRDQTAQSDMVKFAEWCEFQKRSSLIQFISDNNYKEWRIMPHAPYYVSSDFITTTDLLKIFNELNG